MPEDLEYNLLEGLFDQEGAFDEVVRGMELIMHTLSPAILCEIQIIPLHVFWTHG